MLLRLITEIHRCLGSHGSFKFSRKEWTKNGNKNVFVVGHSMLNNMSERGISKQHSVKVRNFPGATTEGINEEINDILQSKPGIIIIHVGINDLVTKINPLNSLRKILKKE